MFSMSLGHSMCEDHVGSMAVKVSVCIQFVISLLKDLSIVATVRLLVVALFASASMRFGGGSGGTRVPLTATMRLLSFDFLEYASVLFGGGGGGTRMATTATIPLFSLPFLESASGLLGDRGDGGREHFQFVPVHVLLGSQIGIIGPGWHQEERDEVPGVGVRYM